MKARVLIVDDEKDFVETLAERLTIRNMEVESVSSGTEALDRIKQVDFDVVLLDVLMPGMDGIETYAEIRKINTVTQVIMLTGHAKIEVAIDGIKEGVYDFLLKPVNIEDLVGKIEMAHQQKNYLVQSKQL